MDKRVALIGGGSFGTAMANVFADAGATVLLWARDKVVVDEINAAHLNSKYLKGLALNSSLRATTDLEKTLDEADIVVSALPTQQIRNVLGSQRLRLRGKPVVNTAKGIERGTHARVSEIFAELSPGSPYMILSGPSFAQEVVQRLPTAVTLASASPLVNSEVQKLMATSYFRAYRSSDVIGVELAGALKNVIAIASGMVTGLKLGYNAQAAIINRGIAELARLGKSAGAQSMTFLGLAGMGDLVLTCTGPLSRNRRVGVSLGEGKKIDDIQRELGGVAEGVHTAESASELAKRMGVEMPITEQVYEILYKGSTPQNALIELMSRELKEE